MKKTPIAIAGTVAVLITGCASGPDEATTRQIAEKMVQSSFTAPEPRLLKRLEQDRAQQICSKIGGAELTQAEAAEVVKLAREDITMVTRFAPVAAGLIGPDMFAWRGMV